MRQLSQISTLLVHTVISGLFLIVDGAFGIAHALRFSTEDQRS